MPSHPFATSSVDVRLARTYGADVDWPVSAYDTEREYRLLDRALTSGGAA